MDLIKIHLLVFLKTLIEECRIWIRYYIKFSFFLTDALLRWNYLFSSAYRLSKTYNKRHRLKEIYTYGETPLTTLDLIVRQCAVLSKDVFLDLGCGTGRTVFWINAFARCKAIGVDQLDVFIHKARQVKKWRKIHGIHFYEADLLNFEAASATVIYLYGSNLDDAFLTKFANKCTGLNPGTKIITVSFPLALYANPHHFRMVKQFQAPYPWGTADVFLQTVI